MSETITEQQYVETTTTEQHEPEQQQDETRDADHLRDPGKRALERERERAAEAEKRAKALQAQVDEFKRAQMTAEEQAKDREEQANRRAAEAEARAMRREIALDPTGDGDLPALSRQDAELLDLMTDEDAMRKLATRLARDAQASQKRAPQPDPAQGARQTTSQTDEDAEYAKYYPSPQH